MPHFINVNEIDYSTRARYLSEYKQRLKDSLIDPTISDERRKRIRDLLAKADRVVPENSHAPEKSSVS